MRNFRCFHEPQTITMAPLTLLVGDNSTGKTSFLALLRALWDVAHNGLLMPNFAEEPFDLGSFDEIAHNRGARGSRADSFDAGLVYRPSEDSTSNARSGHHKAPIRFEATFQRFDAVPIATQREISSGPLRLREELGRQGTGITITAETARGVWEKRFSELRYRDLLLDSGDAALRNWYFRLIDVFESRAPKTEGGLLTPLEGSPRPSTKDRRELRELWFSLVEGQSGGVLYDPLHARPYASAPVRSKPQRSYHFSGARRSAEGDNVPIVLASMFFYEHEDWDVVKAELEKFGRLSGLFDEIDIRPQGKVGSGPFQVEVRKTGRRRKGPHHNLIDMGYGVSQVLPLITEIFRQTGPRLFLIQQPEVHLHPQAQAALGTWFCQIVGNSPRRLVVETHSDHLLDRIRMDIRDGKTPLRPEDVSVLFFERRELDVRIRSLGFDQDGNVIGAPRSYRQFFMEETRRSLGIT